MTKHGGLNAHQAYEVMVNGVREWHGMDKTHAENKYREYMKQADTPGDLHEGKTVELLHEGRVVKMHIPGETPVEHAAYSEGTVC